MQQHLLYKLGEEERKQPTLVGDWMVANYELHSFDNKSVNVAMV